MLYVINLFKSIKIAKPAEPVNGQDKETDVQGILNFSKIHEQFISEESNYVIGEIPLRELLEKRSQLSGRDVFLANIPIFFLNRD